MFITEVYVKAYTGKMVKVVYIAKTIQETNTFLEDHKDCGVIKDAGTLIFIAKNKDLGISE